MKLIHSTLAKSPELYKEVITLIEESFNYPSKHAFDTDFYTLMNPINHDHCHILLNDKKEVVAHIGVALKTMAKKSISTQAAFIGGIAVSKELRGKGIFKEFLTDILSRYEKSCAFFILWSEKDDMYAKFNFIEFGSVLQTGMQELTDEINGFRKESFSKLSKEDFKRIKELYANRLEHYIHPLRSSRDWDTIASISSSSLYISRKNDRIENYFLLNKGFDLPGIIHECSFLNDEELVNAFKDYRLWLPEKHIQYIESHHEIYVGLIKINPNNLFKNFIEDIFKKDIVISSLENDIIHFSFLDKDYKTTYTEFIHMIFGPRPALELLPYSNFFYIPGLDSI
ncbi:GNAT family N-acetyltransferase [Bacteriovorax sp. Seq25_V]|uniref:GNAT family N-acetyltransferase n=1 Tax=Bacteriovorax sp. Seq25_V TaxID=1201288 RepID=UPI00038A4B15|nr:GNAT family N-acetyltransferase [Bacteriovorax sp. Seq25_V]EQC43410.1 acetyltransferase (GNAT) domain protein [Bacteriovorax sp. Seq25_V]